MNRDEDDGVGWLAASSHPASQMVGGMPRSCRDLLFSRLVVCGGNGARRSWRGLRRVPTRSTGDHPALSTAPMPPGVRAHTVFAVSHLTTEKNRTYFHQSLAP